MNDAVEKKPDHCERSEAIPGIPWRIKEIVTLLALPAKSQLCRLL